MMPRLWVYKCNARGEDHQVALGDWATDVFDQDRPVVWGGLWATRQPRSQRILREEMQPGDMILCWQTDRRAAIGLCRVLDLLGEDRDPKLKPVERFATPVRLHELKKSDPVLASVSVLKPGHPGTLYETTPEEAAVLLAACGARWRAEHDAEG